MADVTTPLFTWIHISDIHMSHGSESHRWDQQLVLETLRQDICAGSSRNEPEPDAVFVTGDLAFSGGIREVHEYPRVENWLISLASDLKLSHSRIFLIPGNHDIQRNVAKVDRDVARMLSVLRNRTEDIDSALAHERDRGKLESRLSNYSKFATAFGCSKKQAASASPDLYWHTFLEGRHGLRIRLIGLNTALLCQDNDDFEHLFLGKEQLSTTLTSPSPEPSRSELVVILTHHPTNWLGDGEESDDWIQAWAHVHLYGHIHDAASEDLRSGSAGQFVRVVAGAAHGDESDNSIPVHGYNRACVNVSDDGDVKLRIWPRKWSNKNKAFRVDIDNVPDGEHSASHPLRLVLQPKRRELERAKDYAPARRETVEQQPLQGRKALLIGVSEYLDPAFPDLPVVQQDLTFLRDALEDSRYSVSVHGRQSSEVTRSGILASIRGFVRGGKPDETLLVFLSGHGIHFEGRDYLVPCDASLGHAPSFVDYLVDLSACMQPDHSEASCTLLLVDACREGVRLGTKSIELTGWSRGQRGKVASGTSLMVFSCGPGQLSQYITANDGSQFSLFSRALAEVLSPSHPAQSVSDVLSAIDHRVDEMVAQYNRHPQRIRVVGDLDLDRNAFQSVICDSQAE